MCSAKFISGLQLLPKHHLTSYAFFHAGIVVDGFGSYLAAFWYTMICMGIAGSTCFLVSAIAQQRGGVVLNA